MAMLPRGFDGDVRIVQEFKMDNRDYIAMATAVLLSGVLVLISHSIARI
jgi:cobalt/nickel transport system permease protein